MVEFTQNIFQLSHFLIFRKLEKQIWELVLIY